MLPPLIRRLRINSAPSSKERGFTMALVTVALVAVIGMAALSIDIGTLYQAKAEAQRAADSAALAAARVISISGITGDPKNGSDDGSWSAICGGTGSPATLAAITVAQQNLIAGVAVPSGSVTVTYGTNTGSGFNTDCSSLGNDFGVNPIVSVSVQRAKLPIFFARVFSLFPGTSYSGTGVSATAIAEAFNPSDSGKGAAVTVPVQPRCVKPWIVPNQDPRNSSKHFVHLVSGKINNEGILPLGAGVIGETFNLKADCVPGTGTNCSLVGLDNPPIGNSTSGVLEYVPAAVSGTPGAIPSCSATKGYQPAIAGCDQSTIYACGTTSGATVDLSNENPVNPNRATGDTSIATECLINQSPGTGADSLAGFPAPSFPFQIQAGAGSPLVQASLVKSGDVITSSNSIVTIPIADFGTTPLSGAQPSVTIVGFLQVFINSVNTPSPGDISVTVLNVSGCGDAATGAPVSGTSPVPVRLITPPSS